MINYNIGDKIHYKWVDYDVYTSIVKYVIYDRKKQTIKYLTAQGHSVEKANVFGGETK